MLKKILVMEGGGVKTLAHLYYLKKLNNKFPVLDVFDVFGGSGFSAIIAAMIVLPEESGLDHPKYTFDTMIVDFTELLKVFKDRKYFIGNRYSTKKIKNILYSIFRNFKIKDLLKPIIVPTIYRGNNLINQVRLISSSDISGNSSDDYILIKDIMYGCIAGPPYFDKYKFSDEIQLSNYGNYCHNVTDDLLSILERPKKRPIQTENIYQIFYISINDINEFREIKHILDRYNRRLPNTFKTIDLHLPFIKYDDYDKIQEIIDLMEKKFIKREILEYLSFPEYCTVK